MAIKQAIVSEVLPAKMAARVTFPDRQDFVSDELRVISKGSGVNKDYWLPDVGEQVVVAMFDDGSGQGVILGTYYSDAVPPENTNGDKRRIYFSDGSFIEHDRNSGVLTISCTGDVIIKGANILLN